MRPRCALVLGSGLGNFDVYELAPLPGDSGFVLAGCSGTLDAPRWLYFSQDAGRSWDAVDTELLARGVKHLEWSDPARLEAVAVLDIRWLRLLADFGSAARAICNMGISRLIVVNPENWDSRTDCA